LPWRDERNLQQCHGTLKEAYDANFDVIMANKANYNKASGVGWDDVHAKMARRMK
jgi:hypothetical protein